MSRRVMALMNEKPVERDVFSFPNPRTRRQGTACNAIDVCVLCTGAYVPGQRHSCKYSVTNRGRILLPEA